MITTVSDCLTFQKCPYAWWIQAVAKRKPKQVDDSPLAFGTKVHAELAAYFNGPTSDIDGDKPLLYSLDEQGKHNLRRIHMGTKGGRVIELALSTDVGGHTIYCRPDMLAQKLYSTLYTEYQWKTTSAKKMHYTEYVRISPYSAVYNKAAKELYGQANVNRSMEVGLFVKRRAADKPPTFVTLGASQPVPEANKSLNFVARTADRMEQMLYECKTEEDAKTWSAPGSCIDWTTGTRCPFYSHCFQYESLHSWKFEDAPDRYPEFAAASGSEPQEAGPTGGTDNQVAAGDSETIQEA